MKRDAAKFQYYLITDHHQYRQPLHEAAQQAELHRVAYFQLREKEMDKHALLDVAKHIRPALEQTRFVVNGHLDVALACQADGLHLQAGNIPVAVVRKNFPHLLIGYSAHSNEEILEAESAGADYVLVSPVFPPLSKKGNLPPLGIEKLKEWAAAVRIPVFALGGITAGNLHKIAETGCYGAAGITLFLSDGQFSASGMVI